MKRAEGISTKWAYKEETNTHNNKELLFLDNVQFIYELALAQLELQSLNVNFEITNGLRSFKLLDAKDIEKARKRCAYFKTINGKYSDYFYIVQKNKTRSVNQYLTHWIYPYKGKFHPQMIRALLNIIELEQYDTVLDPFIGSGTTAVESQLLGINCIGIDVSPLCVLQSKVKTESIDVLSEIKYYKNEAIKKFNPDLFTSNINIVRDSVSDISDEKVRNFYEMAELVALSDNARRGREYNASFLRNLEIMIGSVEDYKDIVQRLNLKLGEIDIKIGDARKLPLDDNCIDGIITSPPYSIALDYVANDAHSLLSLGYNINEFKEKFIGVRGKGGAKIELYNNDMKISMREIFRVLKPNKFAVIIIGNATYQGEEIKTVEFTIEIAEKIGFRLVKNIDKIIFGLYNIMQKENILIFRKGG